VALPLVLKSLLPKNFKSGPSTHCKWPRHTNATLHKARRNSRRETWSRPHSSMHKTLWLTHQYNLYGLHCIFSSHLTSVLPTNTLNNQIKMLLIPAIGGLVVLTSIICLFATIRCHQQNTFLILRMSTYIRQTPGVHNRKGSALTPIPLPKSCYLSCIHISPNQQMKRIAVEYVNAQMCKKFFLFGQSAISPGHKHTKQRVKATYMLTWGCALLFKATHLRGQSHNKVYQDGDE